MENKEKIKESLIIAEKKNSFLLNKPILDLKVLVEHEIESY